VKDILQYAIWFNPRSDQLYAYRGITLDMWRKLTATVETLPNSESIFFEALAYQNTCVAATSLSKQTKYADLVAHIENGTFETLQLKYLQDWLSDDKGKDKWGVTRQGFKSYVIEANLGIPPPKIKEIFAAVIEHRDIVKEHKAKKAVENGEQTKASATSPADKAPKANDASISYSECNNALRAYNTGGLWKDGVKDMIKLTFPAGMIKDMALHNVDPAFDALDENGTGTLTPTQIGSLIKQLLTPGVKTDVFEDLMADSSMLGFAIPRPVIHELTDLVDANHDGFLQSDEFVNLLITVVKSDVPGRVIAQIGYTPRQIFIVISISLLNLLLLFMMITLVIKSFTSGAGVAQAVQTICSSASVLYVRSSGNAEFAKEEARLEQWAKEKVIEELSSALNLTSQAVQDMKAKKTGDADKAKE